MSRRKRTSRINTTAQTRAAAIASIDPALDLGNELTLTAYQAAIKGVTDKLDAYNTELSNLDGMLNELQTAEKNLQKLSSRMLSGVGVKFGTNSDEYEKAGGTRDEDRKSSHRTAPATAPAA